MRRGLSTTLFAILLSLGPENTAEAQAPDAVPPRATIAYVRAGAEIRLIEPDGTRDRRLWVHPRPELAANLGITGLAWRPDGEELAFASSHNAAVSWFESDIYAIRPDGTKLRKLTNSPDPAELGRFPKGDVRVAVRNDNLPYGTGPRESLFIVYVAGAPKAQSVTLAPGATKTLLFKDVADLGRVPQPVVAMLGRYRWASIGADVEAGRTADAATLQILGDGLRDFGAFGPAWRHDGTKLSYVLAGSLWSLPADPRIGTHAEPPLFGGKKSPLVRAYDWGVTASTANQIFYGGGLGDYNIYQVTEGSESVGTKLLTYDPEESALLQDIHCLPDGSGFLFVRTKGPSGSSLHRYVFATRKLSTVREFENRTVRCFSLSPDGDWMVLEFGRSPMDFDPDPAAAQEPELWLMRADGKDLRLLVKNGHGPSWSR
jgi:hypothetical protein